MYKTIIKPVLDLLLSILAIVLLFPAFIIISLAIKIDSNGPIFFRQERLGLNGKIFRIYKFRTMVDRAIEKGTGLATFENDPRITKVGAFLRKTSLDEIPQLINILKGEMSFIGPRPPVSYYPYKFEDYNEFEKQRFKVKPGISGLAAIKCREIHDWSINIPIDVEYVQNISFALDVKLFFQSLMSFFRTNNVYSKKSQS